MGCALWIRVKIARSPGEVFFECVADSIHVLASGGTPTLISHAAAAQPTSHIHLIAVAGTGEATLQINLVR